MATFAAIRGILLISCGIIISLCTDEQKELHAPEATSTTVSVDAIVNGTSTTWQPFLEQVKTGTLQSSGNNSTQKHHSVSTGDQTDSSEDTDESWGLELLENLSSTNSISTTNDDHTFLKSTHRTTLDLANSTTNTISLTNVNAAPISTKSDSEDLESKSASSTSREHDESNENTSDKTNASYSFEYFDNKNLYKHEITEQEFIAKLHEKIKETMERKMDSKRILKQPAAPVLSEIIHQDSVTGASLLAAGGSKFGSLFVFVDSSGGAHLNLFSNQILIAQIVLEGHQFCSIFETKEILICNVQQNGIESAKMYGILNMNLDLKVLQDLQTTHIQSVVSWKENSDIYVLAAVTDQDSKERSVNLYELKNDIIYLTKQFNGIGDVNHISNDKYSVILFANEDETSNPAVSVYAKKIQTDEDFHFIVELSAYEGSAISSSIISGDIIICVTSYCLKTNDICDERSTAGIFKFDGIMNPIQQIKTDGAIKSHFFKANNATYLAILNVFSGMKLYQYKDGYFHPIARFQELVNNGLTGFVHLDGLIAVSYGVRSSGDAVQFFKIENDKFKREISNNPMQILSGYKYRLEAKLNRVQQISKLLSSKSKERKMMSNKFEKSSQAERPVRNPVFDSGFEAIIKANVSRIEKLIPTMDRRIEKVRKQLLQGINIKENKVWPEGLKFSSLIIGSVIAKNLEARTVDDGAVPMLNELIPLNGYASMEPMPQKVFRNVVIKNPFVKLFSGSRLFTYVTLNSNHTFDKKISFRSITTPKITAYGLIDGTNISINSILLRSGKQRFDGSLTCHQASVWHLETNTINQYALHTMDGEEMRSDVTYVAGNVHIRGDLFVSGNFHTEKLFGYKLDDLKNNVLKSSSDQIQFVKGKYYIEKLHIKNLLVKNLNNLPLRASIFLNMENKIYMIPSALMESVEAQNIIILKNINNIKVINGSLDVMMLNSPQTISGLKQFQHIHLMNRTPPGYQRFPQRELERERNILQLRRKQFSEIEPLKARLVKLEERLSQLKSTQLFLEFIQESRPAKTALPYYDIKMTSKLDKILKNVNNYLNFRKIDEILELETNDTIEDILTPNFLLHHRSVMDVLSHITMAHTDRVSNIYTGIAHRIGQLERKIKSVSLEKSSLQQRQAYISSLHEIWSPTSVPFSGNVIVGLVAGHYLESLPMFKPERREKIKAGSLKLSGDVIFKNIRAKIINGVDVESILRNAIPLNSIPSGSEIIFHQDVLVKGNIDIEELNGQKTADFAVVNGVNIFHKPVIFKNIASKSDVEIKGTINSYKLKETINSIVMDITEGSRFPHQVTFRNLEVDQLSCGSVNIGGRSVENIVLANETTYISGTKRFTRLKITGPTTKIDELIVKEINGVKLNSLGRQEISGPLNLRDKLDLRSIIVKEDARIVGNIESELGSKNFEKTLADSFSRENFILEHNLILKGPTYIKNLNYSSTLQGLDAHSYNDGLLMNGRDELLLGRYTFTDTRVKNLIVADDNINGLNLSSLVNNAAKLDEDTVFSTDAVFDKIKSTESMTVDGLVQGINLTSDAIWNTEDILFTAKKTFTNEVHLTDNLNVRGSINGMDVDRICRAVVGVLTIYGSAFFNSGIQAEVLSKDGNIVPLDREDSYWMTDRPAVINSPSLFYSLHSDQIFVTNKINGVSVLKLLQQDIPTDCSKIAEGNYIIGELSCNVLDAQLIKTIHLNDYNTDIFNTIILQGKTQHFEENITLNGLLTDRVTTEGLLNGHDFNDFCYNTQKCYVTGKKIFTDGLSVGTSEISYDSLINGIGLGELNLLQKGSYVEEIYIEEYITAPSIKISGTLNGIKFNLDNVMTKSYDQYIKGRFEVSVKGQLALLAEDITTQDGLFGGLNFTKLFHDKASAPAKFAMTPEGEAKYLVKYANYVKQNANAVRNALLGQAITFKGWKTINKLPQDVLKAGSVGSTQYKKFGSHSVAVIYPNKVEIWKYSYSGTYKPARMSVNMNCSNDARALHTSKDLYLIVSSACSSPVSSKVPKVYSDTSPVGEGYAIIWKLYLNQPQKFGEVSFANPLQILVFSLSGKQCFLLLSEGSAQQSIYCNIIGHMYLQQSLHTDNAFMALHDSFVTRTNSKYQLLLIANKGLRSDSPHIDILMYNTNKGSFALYKTIQINRLIWFDGIAFDNSLYLVTVASPFCSSDNGEVIIYRFFEDESSKLMKIEVPEVFELRSPLQAVFLRFPVDTLALLVLDADGFVSTFEKRGIGKFSPPRRFSVGRNTIMEHWNSGKQAFISVSPNPNRIRFPCENNGTVIYEAKFRGII